VGPWGGGLGSTRWNLEHSRSKHEYTGGVLSSSLCRMITAVWQSTPTLKAWMSAAFPGSKTPPELNSKSTVRDVKKRSTFATLGHYSVLLSTVTIAANKVQVELLKAMIHDRKQVLLAARCADVQLVATLVATKDVLRAQELAPPEVTTGAAAGRRSSSSSSSSSSSTNRTGNAIPRYHEDLFRAAGFDSDAIARSFSQHEPEPCFQVVAVLLDGNAQPVVAEPKLSDLLKLKLPHTPGLPGVLPPALSSLLGMGGYKCGRSRSSSAGLAPQLRPLTGLVMAEALAVKPTASLAKEALHGLHALLHPANIPCGCQSRISQPGSTTASAQSLCSPDPAAAVSGWCLLHAAIKELMHPALLQATSTDQAKEDVSTAPNIISSKVANLQAMTLAHFAGVLTRRAASVEQHSVLHWMPLC